MSILDGVEHLRAGLDYHLARHNLLTANFGARRHARISPPRSQAHERFRGDAAGDARHDPGGPS